MAQLGDATSSIALVICMVDWTLFMRRLMSFILPEAILILPSSENQKNLSFGEELGFEIDNGLRQLILTLSITLVSRMFAAMFGWLASR